MQNEYLEDEDYEQLRALVQENPNRTSRFAVLGRVATGEGCVKAGHVGKFKRIPRQSPEDFAIACVLPNIEKFDYATNLGKSFIMAISHYLTTKPAS